MTEQLIDESKCARCGHVQKLHVNTYYGDAFWNICQHPQCECKTFDAVR